MDMFELMQKRIKIANNSLARKMFEDLGYLYIFPIRDEEGCVSVIKDNECYFMFDPNFKDVEVLRQYQPITPELLLAIAQQMRELGWIE
jgi:hypothetical protein